MAQGRICEFERRAVVAVDGPDAAAFLNDLVTNDVARIAEGEASYGGLLSPQGKILFDFLVFRDGSRFLFDISRDLAPAFVQRLRLYKLRAKVDIVDCAEALKVVAAWGGAAPPSLDGLVTADPRLAALGFRAVVSRAASILVPGHEAAGETEYDRHRIGLGVPEGGIDFAFGESFPHDADMDQLGGVDFKKGCYVGQEVVSRMEHRGTARRRQVIAIGTAPLDAGAAVTADGRPIGQIGSVADKAAIALVRLDRADEAAKKRTL